MNLRIYIAMVARIVHKIAIPWLLHNAAVAKLFFPGLNMVLFY